MANFATRQEALSAAQDLLEIIQRFPVASLQSFAPAVGAANALVAAIGHTELVDPSEAAGTARYRLVHKLAPIETEITSNA